MKSSAIAFLLTFLAFTSSPYKYQNTADITRVFNTGKIEFRQAYVSGWVKLNEPYFSSRSLETVVNLVSRHMDVKFDEGEVLIDENSGKTNIYRSSFGETGVVLKIENKYNSMLKNNERVIIIDVTQYGKLWNITDIRDRVTECLQELGSGPPASISMEGFAKGEMPKLKREKLISDILAGIEAEKVESIYTDNLMSVSGYTANIKDYIKSKDRKININIASRYSPSDKKTYFWIGTPVLNIEY